MSAETTIQDPAAVKPMEDIRKTARTYQLVGLVLFCATGTTVAVATVPWLDVGGHGFDRWDALLGIGIATVKALLVAAIFMHLNHERLLIYGIATLAGIHAVGFFVGTYWHFADMPRDSYFYGRQEPAERLSAGVAHPGQGRNSPLLDSGATAESTP